MCTGFKELKDLSWCPSTMRRGWSFICGAQSFKNDIWKAQQQHFFVEIRSWLLWIIRSLCCEQFYWKLFSEEKNSLGNCPEHCFWKDALLLIFFFLPHNIFSAFNSTNKNIALIFIVLGWQADFLGLRPKHIQVELPAWYYWRGRQKLCWVFFLFPWSCYLSSAGIGVRNLLVEATAK